ncbi:MAG: hypothetical protein ACREGB_02200 [Candidatus Saccharimonadales bacterium]
MVNEIKVILEQVLEKRAEIAMRLEDVDPKVRAGVEAKIRNATLELPIVEGRYKDAIVPLTAIVAVTGPESKKFADLALELKYVSFILDYKAVVERIAVSLKKRNGGELYGNQEHFLALDELNQIRLEYNMLRLPSPMINAHLDPVINHPLREALDNMFVKNYGPSLYSAVTRRDIGKEALARNFTGNVFPVVLYNYTGDYDKAFLPNPVDVVQITEEVTPAFIKNKLTAAKARINRNLKKADTTETNQEKTNEQ